MTSGRTIKKKSGIRKSFRIQNRPACGSALNYALALIKPICWLAGAEDLIGNRDSDEIRCLRRAIENHDTPFLFEQLMEAFSLQGISDHAAYTYMDDHGRLTWRDLARATRKKPPCPKLRSYWSFQDCGYQKSSRTCSEPKILLACSVPKHDLRNGRLNQTAYSLFMFIRDIADADIVGWVDERLERSSEGSIRGRSVRMRNALVEPLRNLFGISDKVLNMTLAWILMAAPPTKPLWLETGVSMIAIDTLVHNFLHRTGILHRFKAEHTYGPACYEPNGCADVIAQVAQLIDAREINPNYPRFFLRFVQHAIWRYCAQLELNICNGNQIDDRDRCDNNGCPLFKLCDRVCLQERKANG